MHRDALCLQWVYAFGVKVNKLHYSSRRWTVIASGLLCGALALVVLFTNRGAFFSPLAVVVMGAVGLLRGKSVMSELCTVLGSGRQRSCRSDGPKRSLDPG